MAMLSFGFGSVPLLRADSLNAGDSIQVTSIFNNDPSQTAEFSAPSTNSGIFTDWMSASDSIAITPGIPNSSPTRNIFQMNFSSSDNFQPSDTLTVTVQLLPDNLNFDSFLGLTVADDVQVANASASGNTLSFELTNLDQIQGFGGEVQYIFDVNSTPEPGTIGLFAIGVLSILLVQWKRARKAQSQSVN